MSIVYLYIVKIMLQIDKMKIHTIHILWEIASTSNVWNIQFTKDERQKQKIPINCFIILL